MAQALRCDVCDEHWADVIMSSVHNGDTLAACTGCILTVAQALTGQEVPVDAGQDTPDASPSAPAAVAAGVGPGAGAPGEPPAAGAPARPVTTRDGNHHIKGKPKGTPLRTVADVVGDPGEPPESPQTADDAPAVSS